MAQYGKYPRPIQTTNDSKERAAFYAATDASAPLEQNQFAAGIVQHSESDLYQTWLSTNGLDVTCLCAHRDQAEADAALRALTAFLRSPQVHDPDAATALFTRLGQSGDEPPRPFPDSQVRQIGRGILRHAVDGPPR